MRRFDGFRMCLSLREKGISWELYVYGERECDVISFIKSALRPGGKAVDIGGNLGYYALIEALQVGPTGKVLAVEPDPRNIHLLHQNVALNQLEDRIELRECAVSDRSGRHNLVLTPETNLNRLEWETRPQDDGQPRQEVPVVGIAELLEETGVVDLVRMDIEGFEFRILQGMLEVATSAPQSLPISVLCETHADIYSSLDLKMAPVVDGLLAAGYSLSRITAMDNYGAEQIMNRGYLPVATVRADLRQRLIFGPIKDQDAAALICDPGVVRTVLLTRERGGGQ
jgi:FkbM family methyltransferase